MPRRGLQDSRTWREATQGVRARLPRTSRPWSVRRRIRRRVRLADRSLVLVLGRVPARRHEVLIRHRAGPLDLREAVRVALLTEVFASGAENEVESVGLRLRAETRLERNELG